ncbi:MAG: DUF1512 family protein, partial [Candidatus Bathyarchaeales archaeon]
MNITAVMAALQNQLFQFPGGDIFSQVLTLVIYAFIFISLFYGQRIQLYIMLREVEGSLYKLRYIRDEGRKIAIETIKEIGKPQTDPTARVDRFLEYFTISPQSLDPAGVVWKLEHILDVRDVRFKDEVKLLAPAADET